MSKTNFEVHETLENTGEMKLIIKTFPWEIVFSVISGDSS